MGKPKIRFKGYNDEWEQRKLGDWGNFYYGRSCPKWSVTEDATIPCIRYGELYTKFGAKIDRVYSYTNMPPENLRFSRGTEVLIPRVGEDPMDYNHCTWLSMQDVAIGEMISVFNTDNNPLFTATMFNATLQNEFAMRVEGGSVTNLYFEKLKNIEVSFPSIPEQKKIAAYFENLDRLITLHQRKCDEMKTLKKYMLQKMFPQNGQKISEIRFEGFTDEWEQRKLREITELKSASRVHKDEWTSNGVPFYRSSDVMAAINGTENEKAFISEELYEKLSKVSGKLEEGDILVTGGGSVGNPYIVPDNKPLYTKDADLLWIKNKGKFHPYFLYEFFFSPTFRNYLGSISHVGTIAHYTITQLSDTPICLPSFEEQKEVGEYFQSLDHLITLHQRKCDELKSIKKFMLQNMFI